MIITLKPNTPQIEIDRLAEYFESKGVRVHRIHGENFDVFGLVGDTTRLDERDVRSNVWIENVQRVQVPYRLANRMFHPEDTVVDVEGVKIGAGQKVAVMAGPCSVESLEGLCSIARAVKDCGASILRGGAYKPRTSPYSFQGLGYEGILDLAEARRRTGLPVVSEIMSERNLDEFIEYIDLVQIGARNMQNFQLLKAVGRINKPVMLKRGMSSTVEEWIMAAEYIMANGNPNVIFCERGIRTFEKMTRFTMDLAVIPLLKEKTHLPVVIDPSHASGDWKLVEPVALGAVAAGADGLIIEVHDRPDQAFSDGAQSLKPEKFRALVTKARAVARAVGRDL
ncbi:MAG: 3-deoxy-7-phosphoheptulonate synthase [Spirochaetales bacterium]|nr:3-deoxy-7-phosphoheptulonate synthase [Spirochaetales bacterium]